MEGAYSVGYNNHAKICDCSQCAFDRSEAILNRIKKRRKEPLVYKPGCAVFVRAHLRRQPNYLNKTPRTRKLLELELKHTYH